MPQLTYRESEQRLLAIDPGKWDLSLERLSAVCAYLGNPELFAPTILVGGSNGKGSVVAYLTSILAAADVPIPGAEFAAGGLERDVHEEDVATPEHYAVAELCKSVSSNEVEAAKKVLAARGTAPLLVGSFVKPHIFTIRERVRINGAPVSEELFARCASIALSACEETGIRLTFFEHTFLIAALAFRDAGVDIAIFEVGLGGRFDAVNVCRPFLAVITNVGADHEKYLGATAKSQAHEKAGIVPFGGIAVWGGQVAKEAFGDNAEKACAEADDEIEKEAAARSSTVVRVRKSFQHVRYDYARNLQKVAILMEDLAALYDRPVYENERVFAIDQMGTYQCPNLDCVYFALLALKALGFDAGAHRFRAGLYGTDYRGRFEIFERGGERVIVDAAHNADGMRSFASSLRMYLGPRFNFDPGRMKAPVVFACQEGKDVAGVLREIAPYASRFIAVTVDVLKPMPAAEIVEKARPLGVPAESAASPLEAVQLAGKEPSPWRGFIVCGSIYAMSEIIAALSARGYKSVKTG